jgi:hypothetical protein
MARIDFSGFLVVMTQEALKLCEAHFPLVLQNRCHKVPELVEVKGRDFSFLTESDREPVEIR